MNRVYASKGSIVVLYVFLLSAAACWGDDIAVQRTDIIRSIQSNLTLSKELEDSLSPEAASALRSDVQRMISDKAESLLPDALTYASRGGAADVAAKGLMLQYNDPEYVSLAVTKALMEVKLDNVSQKVRIASVNSQIREQLRENVDIYMKSVQESLKRNLIAPNPWFAEGDIEPQVQAMKKMLIAEIDDPRVYWMTEAKSATEVAELANQFDTRLAGAKPAIGKRLEDAVAHGATDEDMVKTRRSLLGEITREGTHAMLESCVNPKLKSMNPDDVAPGYSDVLKRLDEVEGALGKGVRNRLLIEGERKRPGQDLREEGERALKEKTDLAVSGTGLDVNGGYAPTSRLGESQPATSETRKSEQSTPVEGKRGTTRSEKHWWYAGGLLVLIVGVCCAAVLLRRQRNR